MAEHPIPSPAPGEPGPDPSTTEPTAPRRCVACGNPMTVNNSRPSTLPDLYGQHPLVCIDDRGCAERYSRRNEDLT